MDNRVFLKLTVLLMLSCCTAMAVDDDGVGEDLFAPSLKFASVAEPEAEALPSRPTQVRFTSGVRSFAFAPSANNTAALVKAQAETTTNAVRGLVKMMTTTVGRYGHNSAGPQIVPFANKSRFTGQVTSLKSNSPHKNGRQYEETMTALANKGPVSVIAGENTFWVSPYASNSRISHSDTAKGNSWIGGAIVGYERKCQNNGWKAGLFVGLDRGEYSAKTAAVSGSSKGKLADSTIGVYGEAKIINDLSARLTAVHIASRFKSDGTNLNQISESTYNIYTDAIDMDLNYKVTLNKSWSLRPRLGYMYFHTKQKSYTDSTLAGVTTSVAGYDAHGHEVYGGIRADGSWKTCWGFCAFSAAYDFGAEFGKTGYKSNVSLAPSTPGVSGFSFNKQHTTHYVALESSFYHEPSSLKYSVGYVGGYSEHSQNHAVLAGIRYNF